MQKLIAKAFTLALATSFTAASMPAADHIVSPDSLRQEVQSAVAQRDAKVESLQRVFESDRAEQALESVGMSSEQVVSAVAALDDDSLNGLAERAAAFEAALAAGALNNQEITYILIALGTAVVILVIVAA